MITRAQSIQHRQIGESEKSTVKSNVPARYVDAESKMSFVPPAGWQRSSEAPPPTIVYVAPGDRKSAVNIGLISAPVGDETMEQFVRSNRDYAARTRGLTVYDVAPATLAGAKAMTWRIHVQPPKGTPHETRQIFCVHNRRSYVITLAGLPSNIRKYDGVFDKVVASFQWDK
jgi:hypothetical protein